MSQNASNPAPDRWEHILRRLQSTGFREIAGTRVAGTIPIAESLLNEIVAASIPPDAPVRNLAIQPESGGRFSVRIATKAAFIPAITLKLQVEENPRLPDSAVLVLRMVTLSGLFGLAGGAISGFLPPGIRLDGERILVDLRALAAQRGVAHLLDHVTQLRVTTDAGRLLLEIDGSIR